MFQPLALHEFKGQRLQTKKSHPWKSKNLH